MNEENALRIFLIGGSPEAQPPARLTPAPGELVIAADHGAAHARAWGWPLHLLVGDLDSLSADEAALVTAGGVPVITAPAAKDETDLELALAHALARVQARSSFARRWADGRITCWPTCCCWRGRSSPIWP